MIDIVDKRTRSRFMSGIKGKNTKCELIFRKALFNHGFRYRLHDKTIFGKPDLVLPAYNAVVFIHGCFWHGHNCHLFKWPSTRPEFWRTKINQNRKMDKRNYKLLGNEGWYILTVWECALKGKTRKPLDKVLTSAEHWLLNEQRNKTIRGS